MQAPAKPVAPYVQPRLTTNDTTVRGGPRYIDDLQGIAAVQRAIRDRRVFRAREVQPEARADEQILAGATGFES